MSNNSIDLDALWDYQHPDITESRFRELLPQLMGDPPRYVELLTQLARTQSLQRHFAEAHTILDETQALLIDSMGRAPIRYLLERGRTFNSSGRPDQARPLFLQAYELGLQQQEDFYAIDAAHMLAIATPADEQLAWNLKALDQTEKTSDARAKKWLASLYNNIGWTYHAQGDYPTALDYFYKALQQQEIKGNAVGIRIAHWSVARGLRSLKRIDEALTQQWRLLDEYSKLGEHDGYVYEELGECLLLQNQEAEARPYFALAYEHLSQDAYLAEQEPARLERLQRLGCN